MLLSLGAYLDARASGSRGRLAASIVGFLAALVAKVEGVALVPVLIHLIRRNKPQIVHFAAMRFLAATPLRDYALLFRAQSLYQLGDTTAARTLAARAADRTSDGGLVPSALLQAATILANSGDEAGAAALLRRFLSRHADHAEAARARFTLAQTLLAGGQPREAARVFREVWLTAPASLFPCSLHSSSVWRSTSGRPFRTVPSRRWPGRWRRWLRAWPGASVRPLTTLLAGMQVWRTPG